MKVEKFYVIFIVSFLCLYSAISDNASITIIGTMGGYIYGIDSLSLEKKWTVDTGGPLLSAEQLASPGGRALHYALFPSPDGTLVYSGTDGIKSSATTARALAAASPFLADGVMYTGEKADRVVKIDLQTGNLLGATPMLGNESILLLGRTDIRIRAYSAVSGVEQFNLSYGEITSLDANYQKKTLGNEVQQIGGVSFPSELGMSSKVVHRGRHDEVSIRYECETTSSFDEDGQLFLFSISNGRHSAPLYLDSSPAFSLSSSEIYSLSPSAAPAEISLSAPLGKATDVHTALDFDGDWSDSVVQPGQEDLQVALVSAPAGPQGGLLQPLVPDVLSCAPRELFAHLAASSGVCAVELAPSGLAGRLSVSEFFAQFSKNEVIGFALGSLFLLSGLLWSFSRAVVAYSSAHSETSLVAPFISLEIFHDKELGRGSNGTVVLEGVLEGKRAVAVKKMLSRFQKTVDREISLLSLSDGHPNVVRYFQSRREGDFHLLVLELCNMSLWRFVEARAQAQEDRGLRAFIDADTRAALSQIVQGIAHLHSKNIVHRDVKPHNILLSRCGSTCSSDGGKSEAEKLFFASQGAIGDYCFKISDMGLSKQLCDTGEQSYGSLCPSSHSSRDKGTVGWQPPELIRHRKQKQQLQQGVDSGMFKIDIFGLGCVFHYVLCDGLHPFGSVHDRERNILDGNCDLSLLNNCPDAVDLITRMVDADPAKRPTASQILAHPFFWNEHKRLDFLNHLSERVQNPRGQKLQFHLESCRNTAFRGEKLWNMNLPSVLLHDLSCHGNYDFSTLSDCLRMMRNKRRHSEELSTELKDLITPDAKFNSFFLDGHWPDLLISCVAVVCQHTPHDDPTFEKYCGTIGSMFTGTSSFLVDKSTDIARGAASDEIELVCVRESSTPSCCNLEQGAAEDAIAWKGSALTWESGCRGWWRPALSSSSVESSELQSLPLEAIKVRALHTFRLRANSSYRSHLCKMKHKCTRKLKGKCDFAHDLLELKQKKKKLF